MPGTLSLQSSLGGVQTRSRRRILRDRRAPLLIAVAYFPVARLGLLLQFQHTDVTTIWPASGLAIVLLLVLGVRHWPALAVAAFAVNLTNGLPAPLSAAFAAGSTGEALLGAALLRGAAVQLDLARVRDVILLAVLGALAAPLLGASIGAASLWLSDLPMASSLPAVWLSWWLSDGTGVLVFGPACLAIWSAWQIRRRSVPAGAEGLAVGMVTVATSSLVFLSPSVSPSVLFPIAIWAGVRFEQLGAAVVTLVVSTVATFATVHGSGRFSVSLGTLSHHLLPLQLYTASFSLTALALAAAISSRRRSDERLRERTRELEASNQELEAFTLTVSHDLRTPLRAIHAYSTMLAEQEGERLSAVGAERLATVTHSAQHMSRLIDSLLGLARLGRQRLRRLDADPAQAARAAAGHVHLDLGTGAPELVVEAMPGCRADPVLLEQVYENLIGNAVKFTRGREGAHVRVGALHRGDGETVYFVRDNGDGFDMRDQARLFTLFERLPQHAGVPGIGAGLAIVARIVDRHGGSVWAEGTPGMGATFCFTIGIEDRP